MALDNLRYFMVAYFVVVGFEGIKTRQFEVNFVFMAASLIIFRKFLSGFYETKGLVSLLMVAFYHLQHNNVFRSLSTQDIPKRYQIPKIAPNKPTTHLQYFLIPKLSIHLHQITASSTHKLKRMKKVINYSNKSIN